MNSTIPLTVPAAKKNEFIQNYTAATQGSGNLFLFAADQKIEHLNKDFYGTGISHESADPEHVFKIASTARIGAFATQLGLIARYAESYRNVNYVVKLNSKTDLVPTAQQEPLSTLLHTVADVVTFKQQTNLNIVGVGYTIYLGSEHESVMLAQAAQVIFQAHQHGLLAILWVYPRGKAVPHERDASLIAGAAGIAACLGADFVKINPPLATSEHSSAQLLAQASRAAGNTKVICSGGASKDAPDFLQELYEQLHKGSVRGAAIGRNIHQKDLASAQKFCAAAAALIFDNKDLATALQLLVR